jgi:hypothetical protein
MLYTQEQKVAVIKASSQKTFDWPICLPNFNRRLGMP